MKKRFLSIMLFCFVQIVFPQSNLSWQGYFSYNEIKAISSSPAAIFAASENALFSKNTVDNQIKTINTVDGLSGQTISSLYYSTTYKKTFVGYENGLMIVIDTESGKMVSVVDIINKQLSPRIKKINDFMEQGKFVYVSCDFGIVQFNLETLLFGDTYFIGDNGAEIIVNQTAVFNGFIYAATSTGIRRAAINNSNLNDFKQWEFIAAGDWMSVAAFDSQLIAISNSGFIHRYNTNSNSFTGFINLPQPALDAKRSEEYLVVTTASSTYIYNEQMSLVRQVSSNQLLGDGLVFSCATTINAVVYIGTKENGLYSTTLANSTSFDDLTPSGPLRNSIFALQTTTTSLWTVYGDYDVQYNPYDLDNYGISKYSNEGWLNIPYEKVLGTKSMVRLTVNPANENEIFASSFFSGLLKIVDDVPTLLYNQNNSGLETITFLGPNYFDVRINGVSFDKSGNLWVTNSRVKNGIKVLRTNGQWQKYSTDAALSASEDNSFSRMIIDRNGVKWMGTNRDGVLGFNENGAVFKKITEGADSGNLPISDVRAVALDTRNQLWIGTTKGLRVLSNAGSFQGQEQLTTRAIIIEDDGLAQELLFEQFITDIVVDGANNKWIGTADSGVFMVSPDGQETKYHFTVNNSPLPSNVINDIDINSITGEVFIATSKGLVSFKGVATKANDDLANVYAYPNPVRPGYTGTVKIAGLIDKATIKITDIAGNLVFETTSEGGTIEWDTTAFGKYKVASGVYMIFISAQDGIETTVKKVMIIR
ncbi:MAG: T9SS type A sorting domain-containing protein [Bacteroidetes bacterium]|nr:T9SS type A sorting domain-containing protein [Bacteroidota bacterium]